MLKWNDCAGEGTINLYKYYKKAYKRNIALKLFEKLQGAALSRKKREEKHSRDEKLLDDGKDIVPDEEDEVPAAGAGDGEEKKDDDDAAAVGGASATNPMIVQDADSDDDEDDDHGSGAIPKSDQKSLNKVGCRGRDVAIFHVYILFFCPCICA